MIPSSKGAWTPPNFAKYGDVTYYTDNRPEYRRNDTTNGWFDRYMVGIGGLCSVYDPPVG